MSETIENALSGVSHDEPTAQPANDIDQASGADQSADTEGDDTEQKPKQTPWFQRRIDELTRQKHEAIRERDAALARQIQPGQPASNEAPTGFVPASEVTRYAEKIAADNAFATACNTIFDTGVASHGAAFEDAVGLIQRIADPDTVRGLLETVADMSTAEGVAVYLQLAASPDDAARILSLSPRKQALELAKLAGSKPAPVAVSKAPPPIRPIGASKAAADPDLNEMSPAQFQSYWNKRTRG